MRAGVSILTGVFLLFAGSGSAGADDFIMKVPDYPNFGTPQIIGGTPSIPANWPASLVFFGTVSGKKEMCTSTVIGPQTILTAAHCVDNDGTGNVVIANHSNKVICQRFPQYSGEWPDPRSSYDVALCSSDTPILLVGGKYERISRDASLLAPALAVRFLGYGCRQPGGGGPSGTLYDGISVTGNIHSIGIYVVTDGGAAACYGDSGGAVYREFNPYQRAVAGIVGRGNTQNFSLVTPLYPQVFSKYLEDNANKSPICGINAPSEACHD
jgi:hypothetical protein